jgi:hypothetical protein
MAVQRNIPTTPTADSAAVVSPTRTDQYGGAYVQPITDKEWPTADEGSHYVAISPTAGTGIIGHAAPTTFDETKAYFFVFNNGTNRIYPQMLHLHDTVASAGGARVQFTMITDFSNRFSSGGTSITTINNMNTLSTRASGAVIYQGAVVLSAAGASRRLLGNYCFRGTIDIIEDDYQFVWGSGDGTGPNASRPATVMDASRVLPPVVIGPGHCMALHQWAASQSTGPTFEMVFTWIER